MNCFASSSRLTSSDISKLRLNIILVAGTCGRTMIPKEIQYEGMDWIQMVDDTVQWQTLVRKAMIFQVL